MRPHLSLTLVTILLMAPSLSDQAVAQGAGQLTTCVEAPASAASQTARRKSVRSDCNPAQARTLAILRARANASAALRQSCIDRISPAERQAACAAVGMTPAPAQNAGMGVQ